MVVLGGPGAGKTTFLKFLALAYADDTLRAEKAPALKTPLVPFFVSLPHFARQKQPGSLFDYITASLKEKTGKFAVDFVTRCFNSGNSAIFFDSLDEVPNAARRNVIDQLKEFETSFSKSRIVISCRTADYEEVLVNFHEVEIAKLTKEAITKIVKAWFANDKQNAHRLLNIIETDDGVAGLTETPLLLSLLCIQFRHDLALPKRKVELYRRCVDTLLRDWDATRGFRRETVYEEMSDDRKERLFEHLAGLFFLSQEAYEFDRDEIIPYVGRFIEKLGIDSSKAENVLHEIECHHGIIEKFSQDEYCFSHTSIQDYFVAKHLIAKNTALEYATKNIENENWFPVIEFMVALAEDPEPILAVIMKKSAMDNLSNYPPMARRTRILWLLYRCMASAPFVSSEFSASVYKHLVDTQSNMARIYKNGGVFPIAELESGGVRHPFLWTHKRPTLATALQPFRQFANEILLSPLPGYASTVLGAVADINRTTTDRNSLDHFARDTLLISLLIPLVSIVPKEVLTTLSDIKARQGDNYIGNSLARSITVLTQSYIK